MSAFQAPATADCLPSHSITAAEVEAEARRRAQREAAEANRLHAQRRAAVEAAQRAAEQEALRRTMAAEVRGLLVNVLQPRKPPPKQNKDTS